MKNFYVYIKDIGAQEFWTVHVTGLNLKDVLAYAKYRCLGGDSFGIKEFINSENVPNNFQHGTVEVGLKGF